ncbi:protein POOR HOMOLOGOUS SYNAPSIS 1 [Spinacia oleracea]|uniref:Protein POOR HOMOLOGOUS SYNAPSIS 1-like n=1 Tax=Spinacia oleracea TaxID=3562 RepID=A0A9R0J3K5_SPIOL|nr:protein POOR HOMOLOGOUS SYNAPSIS 1-like [Spinacia oleracea]XP_021860601.1 protein POOR HOMOLOGOUS SYNAPSIS 1-like [Spinacia oleracea]
MTENAHWKIQYARFFNFPQTHSSTTTSCSLLRPLYAGKRNRVKGTWLPSSSSNVSLHILFFDHSFSEPTLVVSLDENIYEEHYISKLNFTWPQGINGSGCVRKSRVVFASYRDGMGQIQKFALRFFSFIESQKFMESLKCLKEQRNGSNGLPQRMITEGSNEEHTPFWGPSINQEHVPYSCPEPAAQGHAVGSTDVALPQSFTSLLADCCTGIDLGVPQVPAEVDLNHFFKEKKGADKFLDMVDMMDTVIIGMGGNLAI